jgi:RNA polymerase sigma factor (TIGR02999 family)
VNEVDLRLVWQRRVAWQSRAHFLAIAAQMMRRVLVDHARASHAAKRPRRSFQVALDDRIGAAEPRGCDVLALDRALEELSTFDCRLAQIIELRYFAGLTELEVAEVLSISRATVTREWQTARAWLYRRMTSGREGRRHDDDVAVGAGQATRRTLISEAIPNPRVQGAAVERRPHVLGPAAIRAL